MASHYIGRLPKSERGKHPFDDEIDEEILPQYQAFQEWLVKETGVEILSAEQAAQRVLAAQIKLQVIFNEWMEGIPKLW